MNVVITGSSQGIGRAVTNRLLAQGHSVMGLARAPQWDLSTKHEQGDFKFQTVDVSDWAQVSRASAYLPTHWATVDALICCAGVQRAAGRTLEVDPVEWMETLRINLDGTFFAIRAFVPLMSKIKRSKIICFSGGGATKARPRFAAYAASKVGVVRLVETIALEESNIDINAIAPGRINTRLLEEQLARGPGVIGVEEYATSLLQKADGGASIENVLTMVDWLLSPQSDGTSGQLMAAQYHTWSPEVK